MKNKLFFKYLLYIAAIIIVITTAFAFGGIQVKADNEKKEVGYEFENSWVKYRILTQGTSTSLGTVEVIGLSRALTIVNLYETVYEYDSGDSFEIVSISKNAFKGYKSIRQFAISEDSLITQIPEGCLSGCSNLNRVSLKNTCLKKIGKNAFKGCKKLKYFTIYTSKLKQKSIGKNAFKGVKGTIVIVTKKQKRYITYFQKRGAKSLKLGITKRGSGYYVMKK